jgi:hypothetical protein
MIARQMSAAVINEIVNHPSIYPWVSGPVNGPLDLSKLIESGDYVALFGEHGGFLFYRVADVVYDAHSAVLPDGRGRWAIRAAHEALRMMFETDAEEILMAAPKGNLAVLSLIRSLKAKYLGTIDGGWWLKGEPVPSDIYSLTKTDYEKCLSQHH